MKLSMEEVQKQHESTKKLYEQGLTVAPVDVKRVLDLYDTIEALQQEIKELKKQLSVCGMKDYLDRMFKAEDENEQLRAHVARMRELLTKAYDEIEKYKCL